MVFTCNKIIVYFKHMSDTALASSLLNFCENYDK